MTIINSTTVVVYNFDELKTVLEGNNTYELIYFGADITLTGGISILASKSKITIDGTYDNVRYTYTDYNSASPSQTIYLNSSSNLNITVQNIDVIGRNYYGVICVYDIAALNNVIVNYINVNYNGPQMAYNPRSTLNIIDCNITIQSLGVSAANEVAETRNVTLGGTVNINSYTTGTSVFWFRNVVGGVYPYFNVLPDSNIYINTENMYLYYISDAAYINMTFGNNSVTNIITDIGMIYDNSHVARNVLIDNNAELNITQKRSFGSTWSINGELKMNPGSSLKMISDFTGSSSNYCILFYTTNASLVLDNPKSLVLYNNAANAIYSLATMSFTCNISQYNRWTSVTPFASAGDIYDIPTYSWYKIENINNLVITGTLLNNNTTITSTNLTPSEELQLPLISNLLLTNTKVLSMGRPSLSLNPITDVSLEITGVTESDADVKISYDENDYYVQADINGNFLYSYASALPIGTEISFIANVSGSFLYRFRTVEIIYEGDLYISAATSEIIFSTTPFNMTPTLCQRITPLKVVVEDSRITPTVWKLYATITSELINENGDVLTNGLVFVDENDNITVLSDTPTLVYTSDGITTGEIDVEWSSDKGILLQLNIVPIVNKTTYKTNINWSIENN